MSVHQFIYTSCNKGINDTINNIIGDGQKLYSKDLNFTTEDYKIISNSMFDYQAPISSSTKITDELVKSFPKSFRFAKLDNGHLVFISNIYGKDYTGRRYGNIFRHCLLFDNPVDLPILPIELYKNSVMRENLSKEEAYSETTPPPLSEVTIQDSGEMSFQSAMNFINSANYRITVLKSIILAVLNYSNTKKQILICDTPENIPYWIASVSYLLPRVCINNLTFNTYIYNPSQDKDSIILGVFDHDTQYNINDKSILDKYYVYDIIHNNMSLFDNSIFEKYKFFEELQDIINDNNIQLIQAFSDFILESTSYRTLDLNILQAYEIYLLYRDLEEDLDDQDYLQDNIDYISRILYFAENFLNSNEQKTQLVQTIINNLNAFSKYDINLAEFNMVDITRLIQVGKVLADSISMDFIDELYDFPIIVLMASLFMDNISLSDYSNICGILKYFQYDEQYFYDNFETSIYNVKDYSNEKISFDKLAILYDGISENFELKTFQDCVGLISKNYIPSDSIESYIQLVEKKAIELDVNLSITISNTLSNIYPEKSSYIWDTFYSLILETLSIDNMHEVYSNLSKIVLQNSADIDLIKNIYEYIIQNTDNVTNEIMIYFPYFVELSKGGKYDIDEISSFIETSYNTIQSNKEFDNNVIILQFMSYALELLELIKDIENSIDNSNMEVINRISLIKKEISKTIHKLDRSLILIDLYENQDQMDEYSNLESKLSRNNISCNTLYIARIINYKNIKGLDTILDIYRAKTIALNTDIVLITANSKDLFKIISDDLIASINNDTEFKLFMNMFNFKKDAIRDYCYYNLLQIFIDNAAYNQDTKHQYKPLRAMINYLAELEEIEKIDEDCINHIAEQNPFKNLEHTELKALDKAISNQFEDKQLDFWNKLKKKNNNIFGKLFNK